MSPHVKTCNQCQASAFENKRLHEEIRKLKETLSFYVQLLPAKKEKSDA